MASTGTFSFGAEAFGGYIHKPDPDPGYGAVTFNLEAHFAIAALPEEAWQIQLQHPVSIVGGQQYTLCYDAKAAAARTFEIVIDGDMDSEYVSQTDLNVGPIALTTEYETYFHTFMATVDDETARVTFNLGLDTADVYFDNIGMYAGDTCGALDDGTSSSSSSSTSSSTSNSGGAITARQAVSEMGMGINLGNSLDAFPEETSWGATRLTQAHIKAVAAEGFGHVRLPATWNDYTAETPPYAISTVRLNRAEQLVDWALAEGLYVIINVHHDGWIKSGYGDPANRARFKAIWDQLIERFGDKPYKLIFEMLNEPGELAAADNDQLNKDTLAQIRAAQPQRLVVYAGTGFSPIDKLIQAQIPDQSDSYLFANFHAYDPWQFGGQCARRWGSAQDIVELENIYKQAAFYSSKNNNVPLMVNEFGAALYDFMQPENVCNKADRLNYLKHHAKFAKQYSVVPTVWDDDGSFRIYHRSANTWDDAKDSILDEFGRKP